MKKMLYGVCVIVLLTSLAFADNSEDDPKSLARQMCDLIMEFRSFMANDFDNMENSSPELNAFLTKADEFNKKYEKLSDEDKAIVETELQRLMEAFEFKLD
jgi:hypothetical protein